MAKKGAEYCLEDKRGVSEALEGKRRLTIHNTSHNVMFPYLHLSFLTIIRRESKKHLEFHSEIQLYYF